MPNKMISQEVTFYAHPTLSSMQRLAEESKDIPDMRLLFGRYIPEDCLIHFPSPRGVGKSWLCMQLCIAVAAEWSGYLGEEINHFGNTLYINNELSEKIIRRRAGRLISNAPFPVKENFKAMVYTTRNNLSDDLPNIIRITEKLKPVLVVIDNLRMAFTDVDTNSNREITKLMFTLLGLCQSSKTSVLATDHFRKHTSTLLSGSDLQAGSGVKTDLADGDFFLRLSFQDKNLRILKRGKSRHFEDDTQPKLLLLNPQTMWFELKDEQVNEAEHIGIHQLKDKEEQKDIAVALRQAGKSFEEIARILNKGKGTIHRWLQVEKADQ